MGYLYLYLFCCRVIQLYRALALSVVLNRLNGALCFRRKAKKSTSNGTATQRPDKRENASAIYEMATEVVGPADTLDRNGRLVSVTQADRGANTTGPASPHADATAFAEYETAVPVSQPKYPKPQPQIDAKRAARAAQHGAGTPGDGHGRGGADGAVNDGCVDDKALYMYANAPTAAAAAVSAGGPGLTPANEPICTSINDFTLVDNAIYNS